MLLQLSWVVSFRMLLFPTRLHAIWSDIFSSYNFCPPTLFNESSFNQNRRVVKKKTQDSSICCLFGRLVTITQTLS